jgi:S-adenosylmethionine/arginine decarboxylase-like enzyme
MVHHQAIIVATVRRQTANIQCEQLRAFLAELVDQIGMQKLFEPIAIHGKFGFTGIVGIVTSHVAFHFFDNDQSLHFDIYSCKEFDLKSALKYIDGYWGIETSTILFIKRDKGPEIDRFTYANGMLTVQNEGMD